MAKIRGRSVSIDAPLAIGVLASATSSSTNGNAVQCPTRFVVGFFGWFQKHQRCKLCGRAHTNAPPVSN